MSTLQRSIMAAVERAQEQGRCKSRCRYHLRKWNLSLLDCNGAWLVVCRTSMAVKFRAAELAMVEAWVRAKGGQA